MKKYRLSDYLEHIQQAATDASNFIQGLDKESFFADKRTQQADIMNLIIMGEASGKVMDEYTEFTRITPEIPWRGMRGMRNRIAHGYFEINLDIVWETVEKALPELVKHLMLLQTRKDLLEKSRHESF